uniref:Uncharacterized protein n=1 Tax=Physcomitrium patens TaxID=3218 RepID=A0A2K1JY14_PHYPA|nr:hypothetical protein PHYPA_013535 [Physcomitrium patens]
MKADVRSESGLEGRGHGECEAVVSSVSCIFRVFSRYSHFMTLPTHNVYNDIYIYIYIYILNIFHSVV